MKVILIPKTDILEIAKYKANILNTPKANTKENPINNWHFSKPEVFKAIEKISTENSHLQRSRGIKLLENISYELSHDMETLCHFALYARLTLEDFNSLKLSQKSLAHINKHLFIKRKYRRVSMRPTILKGRIRKYVIDRIVNFSFNDLYFQGEAIRQLTPKKKNTTLKNIQA